MKAQKTRWVACGSIVAGLLVLGGSGYALRDRIIEEWHIRKLRSDDYTERFRAAKKLGGIRSRRALPALVALLGESREHSAEAREVWGPGANPCVSMAAVLEEIGPAAIPSLAWVLEESDGTREFWRRTACNTLGKIGTASAVPALIARVKDVDGCVGLIAINRLGAMGPRAGAAVPALAAALSSEKAYLRTAASRALKAIRSSDEATVDPPGEP